MENSSSTIMFWILWKVGSWGVCGEVLTSANSGILRDRGPGGRWGEPRREREREQWGSGDVCMLQYFKRQAFLGLEARLVARRGEAAMPQDFKILAAVLKSYRLGIAYSEKSLPFTPFGLRLRLFVTARNLQTCPIFFRSLSLLLLLNPIQR